MTPLEKAAEANRLFHTDLEARVEQRIREIVREEILAASRASDTLPCPPPGDSHSGAIVVPRGSSRPPAMRRDDACDTCGMICCVCPHRFGCPPTDGSDGEGGP